MVDETVLLHAADDGAAGDQIADFGVVRLEAPLLRVIERLYVDSARQERSLRFFGDSA